MIYASSYFTPQRHKGLLIGISQSVPKGFAVDERLGFFTPSADLLKRWKAGMSEADYTAEFREQIKSRWFEINGWLQWLQPNYEATLLCWEKDGEFCHRHLIGKLIQHHRPDCWGGEAVEPVIELITPTPTHGLARGDLIEVFQYLPEEPGPGFWRDPWASTEGDKFRSYPDWPIYVLSAEGDRVCVSSLEMGRTEVKAKGGKVSQANKVWLYAHNCKLVESAASDMTWAKDVFFPEDMALDQPSARSLTVVDANQLRIA